MIRKKLAAAALLFAFGLNANAVPVTFDVAGESTSYANVYALCLPFCGVSASLDSQLDSQTRTMSVGDDPWTFNVFSLNLFGFGAGGGVVEVFLGFDLPTGAPAAEGSGGGLFATADILGTAGGLLWTQQPGLLEMDDGTKFSVFFSNLLGATRDQDIIVQATLTLWNEPGSTSVPEPGVLALLGVGLLGLGFVGRRRKGATA